MMITAASRVGGGEVHCYNYILPTIVISCFITSSCTYIHVHACSLAHSQLAGVTSGDMVGFTIYHQILLSPCPGLLPHTGLLPTPGSASAFSDSKQSRQGPHPPMSKPKPSPTGSRTPPRSRPIPKSYKVPSPPPPPTTTTTTTVTNDSLSATLHVPVPPHARSASRSVSPLATHSLSTHDSSQDKTAPSPIRWPVSPSSRGSDSESRTPSPMHRGNTPRAYRPVISPIMLSEGSDSARSPSPLSLVRRENGVQVYILY